MTRKITKAAARIKLGLQDQLLLGDLTAKLDFGFAGEYMEAAHNIMQLDEPDDFCIGTGEAVSVQQFLDEVFAQVGIDPKTCVGTDERFMRPGKTSTLIADYSKATKAFGYEPKIKYKQLIEIMLKHDLETESAHLS